MAPKKRSLSALFESQPLNGNGASASKPEAPVTSTKGKTTRKTLAKDKAPAKRPGRPSMAKRKEAQLERKEITLTADQADELMLLCRSLNRERDKDAAGAEPITESALIRSAVHTLLQVKKDLTGDNEEQLLNSLLEALGL